MNFSTVFEGGGNSMQSMKGLTREDMHIIVDRICDANEASDNGSNLFGSMLQFKDFGSDITHTVIVVNTTEEIIC